MKTSVRTTTTVLALAALGLTGCAGMSGTERGALIGAGVGAAAGGVIGNQTGSTARGAIIGAAVGGAAGALIGRQMDKQAAELDASIPGATVTRVGEGIAVTFESGLLYPYDSAELYAAGQQNLANLANSLKSYPDTEVLIVGHTDSQGSDQYNYDLSLRRANSARSYLIAQGVPSDRIRTEGRGEMEPIADNGTATGQQQNRRVEVAIFASKEYRDRLLKQNQ